LGLPRAARFVREARAEATMSEKKSYRGGCHCGNVQYSIQADLSGDLISCNCSICQKTGTILAFIPAADFKLEKGEEHLKDYLFNKKAIHHFFCTNCGVRSFARGTNPKGGEMAAINVRCLEGVELEQLHVKHVNGRAA
jgi:hypothetical protein